MLQLRVSQGLQQLSECEVRNVPFVIGKSARSDLRLESAGVWDRHLSFELDPENKKFRVSAIGDALLLLNGESCRCALLKNGDLLQIGGCEIRVALSAASQYALKLHELGVYLLLLLVFFVQIAMIFLLR
jgi:hypothetical protein